MEEERGGIEVIVLSTKWLLCFLRMKDIFKRIAKDRAIKRVSLFLLLILFGYFRLF